MKRGLILICLFFAALNAKGDEASFDKQFWTLFGFSLNDVSLRDVQARLGPAKIFDVPNGHYERAICYRSTDDSIVVVFSSGELGGGKQLLGVSLQRAFLHKYPCSKPAIDLPATFPMGLHLGMAKREFLKTVRVPFEEFDDATLRRLIDLKRPITVSECNKRYGDTKITRIIQEGGGMMDVTQSFWVTLRYGKVVALNVWKQETF